MAFYKLKGNDMIFQLLNLDVKEDFSVWDDIGKRYLRQLEGVANIDDLKFMKADLFKQKYPNFRKAQQHIRHIAVYESDIAVEYDFGFKKTANEQINAFIANMQAVRQDPLAVRLLQRTSGSGLQKSYQITALDAIGNITQNKPFLAPQQQERGLAKPIQEKPQISLEKPLVLSPEEQQIMALFEQDKEIYSRGLFEEIFKATLARYFPSKSTTSERVYKLFKEVYNGVD